MTKPTINITINLSTTGETDPNNIRELVAAGIRAAMPNAVEKEADRIAKEEADLESFFNRLERKQRFHGPE